MTFYLFNMPDLAVFLC